jgi:hypothetical protein
MLADAARILAERDPQGLAELARQLGGASPAESGSAASKSLLQAARSASQSPFQDGVILSEAKNLSAAVAARVAGPGGSVARLFRGGAFRALCSGACVAPPGTCTGPAGRAASLVVPET